MLSRSSHCQHWLTTLAAIALIAAACSSSATEAPTTTGALTTTEAPTTTATPTTSEVSAGDFEPDLGLHGVGDPVIPEAGTPGIDIARYDLELDLTGGGFDAVATIEGAVIDPDLDQISLDLIGLEVTKVTLDGAGTNFVQTEQELLIPAPLDPDFTLVIAYSGKPKQVDANLGYGTVGWANKVWGSFVASEPTGAQTWFPTNDHPTDKANFSISVTVDEGTTVVGPGPLLPPEENTYHFEPTEPMAPYLASITVGDFAVTETTGDSGIPIKIAVPTKFQEDLQRDITDLDAMISELEEIAGPFPFDSYGAIGIPTDLGFALENQTLSLFDVDGITDDEIQAHELAHQWFGDHVSVASWEDIWLNEGFATWMEYWWTYEGDMSQIDPLLVSIPAGFLGPIIPSEPSEMFSTTVYIRGGLTLEALRRDIGHDSFVVLLQEWVNRFGGGNASTQNFLDLVEELEGPEAATATSHWIYDETTPVLIDSID